MTCDPHLGKLENDGAGITHNTGSNLDQLQLQAGQRPISDGLGQIDATQKCGKITGYCVQVQPHLIAEDPLARQTFIL
jgi:hypothetical protein